MTENRTDLQPENKTIEHSTAAAAAKPTAGEQTSAAVAEVKPADPKPIDIQQTETNSENFWARIKAKWPKREKTDEAEVPVSELRWVRVRLIPIWLRLVILLVLVILAAIVGAMIGYSVIGDGSAVDVFKKDTWRHIFDIINGRLK